VVKYSYFNPTKKCVIISENKRITMKFWIVCWKRERNKKQKVNGFTNKKEQLSFVKELRKKKDVQFCFSLEKVCIEQLYGVGKK
jgi:hypothetical protein